MVARPWPARAVDVGRGDDTAGLRRSLAMGASAAGVIARTPKHTHCLAGRVAARWNNSPALIAAARARLCAAPHRSRTSAPLPLQAGVIRTPWESRHPP